jgi:DnaJ-class molecular chaperone
MRKLFVCIILSLVATAASAQGLDAAIRTLAGDMAQKINKKNRSKLAVADFLNGEGKIDPLTEYIRTELEMQLINADNLQVMDRKHLKKLMEENHLQSQGLIDESMVRSATGFIKIEGLILGEITYVGEQVKIKITATDVNTSLLYAASSIELTSDVTVKNILNPEAKLCSDCGGRGTVQIQSVCTACSGNGSTVCRDCKGTGKRAGMTVGSYVPCESCDAKGKFTCHVCAANGKIISYQTCPKCNGKIQAPTTVSKGLNRSGNMAIEFCPDCAGTGKFRKESVCNNCSGSGEEPFGPRSNWEKRVCKLCTGKKVIVSIIACQRCDGLGKL